LHSSFHMPEKQYQLDVADAGRALFTPFKREGRAGFARRIRLTASRSIPQKMFSIAERRA
jgi:hypothetical protein